MMRNSGTLGYMCITLEIKHRDGVHGDHVSLVGFGENPAKSIETPTTIKTQHISHSTWVVSLLLHFMWNVEEHLSFNEAGVMRKRRYI